MTVLTGSARVTELVLAVRKERGVESVMGTVEENEVERAMRRRAVVMNSIAKG